MEKWICAFVEGTDETGVDNITLCETFAQANELKARWKKRLQEEYADEMERGDTIDEAIFDSAVYSSLVTDKMVEWCEVRTVQYYKNGGENEAD